MKRIVNYLENNHFYVIKYRPHKSLTAFLYPENDIEDGIKGGIGLHITYKNRLYSLNIRDYKNNEDGELDFIVSEYSSEILKFIKEYKIRRKNRENKI